MVALVKQEAKVYRLDGNVVCEFPEGISFACVANWRAIADSVRRSKDPETARDVVLKITALGEEYEQHRRCFMDFADMKAEAIRDFRIMAIGAGLVALGLVLFWKAATVIV